MKLYYNPASPFVRKVLVVAAECGLTDQIKKEEIVLTPVSPHAPLNDENPLGKIPSLVLDNNQSLYDSRVICEYLDTHASGGLFPATGADRWTALRRQALADGFCDAAVSVRYEGFVRPEDKQWSQWIEAQLNKCKRVISVLENEADTFGNTVDVGTLSIAIALSYFDFRNSEEAWRDTAPKLAEWYAVFSQRDSLIQTQPA